ncbi:MAG: permease [Planctomycetes bacterium]|nr:permease [Planctomycetota bacterium]
MLVPTIIMGILALAFFFTAYFKGGNKHMTGITLSAKMLLEIAPLLICAFIVAGMVQVLIPKELMLKWVGAESGFRGILVGTVSGGFMVGGPYVSLPLAAGLMKAGAGTATMVAFITSWSLWAVSRMPMEIGILGWKFTMIRLACTFFFPPIAGLIAMVFFTDKL